MKTLVLFGLLIVGLSGQALSMGHPHNVFAARKQLRAKPATSVRKPKAACGTNWQAMVQIDKSAFSRRLLAALSQVRPTRAY